MTYKLACGTVHVSWALVRVAKALLETPSYDPYDLARVSGVARATVDNLIARMSIEGWLTTEDGWNFEVTPTGRRELARVLSRARTSFSAKGASS